jgi:hypothetical protein
MRARLLALAVGATAIMVGGSQAVALATPSKHPAKTVAADSVSLSGWNPTIPVDSSGGGDNQDFATQ